MFSIFPKSVNSPHIYMNSEGSKAPRDLTPQQVKLVEKLVTYTPKLSRSGRRLAVSVEEDLFAQEKDGVPPTTVGNED